MSKINDYARFVETTTSEMSKNTLGLSSRILKLEGNTSHMTTSSGKVIREAEIHMATLLTSVVGILAESGWDIQKQYNISLECMEISKKVAILVVSGWAFQKK